MYTFLYKPYASYVCKLIQYDQFVVMLQVTDIKAVQRVAMQNSVAIDILVKSMQQDQKLQDVQISWDFSHHPLYPSIRVKHVSRTP